MALKVLISALISSHDTATRVPQPTDDGDSVDDVSCRGAADGLAAAKLEEGGEGGGEDPGRIGRWYWYEEDEEEEGKNDTGAAAVEEVREEREEGDGDGEGGGGVGFPVVKNGEDIRGRVWRIGGKRRRTKMAK